MSASRKILIIGLVWPEPGSSAAGTRMLQLIHFFAQLEHEIGFASAAQAGEFFELPEIEEKNRFQIAVNDAGFDEFLRAFNPDWVVFDRFISEEQFGWRVAEVCPNALRILDTEDIHGIRYARRLALEENRALQPGDWFNDTAKREMASIYRCDVSLIISIAEMELLRSVYQIPEKLLFYLPYQFAKPAENHAARVNTFENRKDFLSIGNFLHAPNADAVAYLKSSIWPLIKAKLPEANMNIYGAYASEKHLKLSAPKVGFFVHGRVENAEAVFQQSRVLLAPLRFGAGLKGKLAEAMLHGTPSVTTSVGAEGMTPDGSWNGSICDTPETFAQSAIELYTNKITWEKAQMKGFALFTSQFTNEQYTADLQHLLESIYAELPGHRLSNFTGAMLLHHTLQGTKYMSRWIELKNKIQ